MQSSNGESTISIQSGSLLLSDDGSIATNVVVFQFVEGAIENG